MRYDRVVRGAVLVLLAGCMQTASDPGPSTGECKTDDDCNGNICARDHWCHPARAIISIKTTWTVRGMTADAFTCQSSPDLEITFTGPNGEWALGYLNGQVAFDLQF